MYKRLRLNWIAASVLVLVLLGLAAYDLLVGFPHATSAEPHATSAEPSALAHPVTHRHVGHGRHASPTPKTTTPGAVAVGTLSPASATALAPDGTGQGDNSDLAYLAIDGNPATAWHTDWYTTARFGNLYTGMGLLVDMGRSTTITAVRITLGPALGASFQLRVGTAPALADLPSVAQATNAGGVVYLRLTTPAHGRYVLIWFTSLPPDPAGSFQVSVYDLQLEGQA